MLDIITIYLEAINPPRHFRGYRISIGKDLLGEWMLHTAYGKIGGVATTKNYSFENYAQAYSYMGNILKKRFSAHKRIGCNYEIKHSYGVENNILTNKNM